MRPQYLLDGDGPVALTATDWTVALNHLVIEGGPAERARDVHAAPAHFLPVPLGRGSETVVRGCLSA